MSNHAGHGRTNYSCGHLKGQCRCPHGGVVIHTLSYPCTACAEASGVPSPAECADHSVPTVQVTLQEKADKLARTLSRGVKTRNVGVCERCGGTTSSGMDPYCQRRCAGEVAAEIAVGLATLTEDRNGQ